MRAAPWVTCLWPGLSRLWLQGQWSSLFAAIGAALLLNYVLLASFLWPELIPARLMPVAWLVVAIVWIVGIWRSICRLPKLCGTDANRFQQDLFLRAQGEYLRGHWFEAEALVQQLLADRPNDVDAHLMLATLYRHTNRVGDARQQLYLLERLDGADKWRLETEHERRLLDRLEQPA